MTNYNGYNIETLKKYYETGKKYSNINEMEYSENFSDDQAYQFACFGCNGAEIDFTVKKYIRIGEPVVLYDCYMPSWNFANDKREKGVSVVTENWLKSLKSVFFNISNETLKTRGVYEIEGIAIANGGDDETLIYPTNWAKKTNIKSRSKIVEWLKNN